MQSLQGGGAERVTLDVIKHLDKSLFEPTILVVNYFGELVSTVPKDIKVIPVLREREKSYFHFFKVIRTVLKAAKQSDLIIGTLEMTPTYLASIVSVLTKKPAIGWVHIDVKQYPKINAPIHRYLTRKLYKRLKVVIAVSDGAKKSFEEMFPNLQVRVKRIYNPIRIEEISHLFLEQHDLEEVNEPIILGIGRLTAAKGFDNLIKAHKYLLDQKIPNQLIILGEGDQRASLETLIAELQVQKSVRLKGFVNNPYKYLRTANVFVLSSRYEGFSLVVAEALAAGIPVVSTNCQSGPAEILEDGKYGLLSPQDDYKALGNRIHETIMSDSEQNKHERILRANDFSLQKIIPEYEYLFRTILEETPS
ncbi:glycosyltransferase [Robertmurraya kyonggiensis]|nr:glycosyltransferase [Robertmurraya kyonggiensis]